MPTTWTKDRIETLKKSEIVQLRANAARLRQNDVVALCDEVLKVQPKRTSRKGQRQRELDGRPLTSRAKAFEMRGVKLRNPRWSWGGIRASDETVVFTMWAKDIQHAGDVRRYMLWGPNRGGDRPWSDTTGGKERLEHCRLATLAGEAEGLLIYGEQRGDDLPLTQASKVTGADPHTVLRFQVQQEGDEYWAVWNSKGAPTSPNSGSGS
jgi:hypothetical protein